VQVIYLVAPLLTQEFGPLFSYIGGYHSGIALINVNTGFNITINYDADDFLRNNLFPFVTKLDNGTKVLEFVNGGANFIYMGINLTYWTQERTVIGEIDGTMYNTFMSNFNANTNASHPYYNLVQVTSNFSGKPFLPAYTCFDFVWESFTNLYKLGMRYEANLSLKATLGTIYAKSFPQNVSLEYYAAEHDKIVAFYEFTEAKFGNMTFHELAAELFFVFDGDFYLRVDATLYKVKLKFPLVDSGYYLRALPWQ